MRPAQHLKPGVAVLGLLVTVLVAVLGLTPGLATAIVSDPGAGRSAGLTAGSLSTPVQGSLAHPTTSGSTAGSVRVSWTTTLTRAVTFLVQRAPTSSPTSWTTANGAGTSSTAACGAATLPATVSCSYTDTSAAYGGQWVYRVVQQIGGWNATSGSHLALSLLPAAATLTAPTDLTAVSALSSTAVWAVGANCTVDFWDGTTWTQQAVSTATCPAGTRLMAVNANGGSVTVAGAYGIAFGCTSACTTSAPVWWSKSAGAVLVPGITSTSSTQVFGGGELCQVLTYNWTTNVLVTISPPTGMCGGHTVRTMTAVGSNVVAAGDAGLVMVCTGGCTTSTPTWWQVPTAVTGTTTAWWGSWSSGTGSVLVVGSGGRLLACSSACDTSAGVWAPESSGTTTDLRAVTADPSTGAATVVGNGGLALSCSALCTTPGSTWTPTSTGTTQDLVGVTQVSSSPLTVWAVGPAGTALVLTSGAWSVMAPPPPLGGTTSALTGSDLTAVSSPDASPLGARFVWPSTPAPTSCTGTAVSVTPTAPTLPTGSWTVKAVRVVTSVYGNTTYASGTLSLLVSSDGGSTWKPYPLTAPATYGTPGYGTSASTTTALSPTPSISALSSLRLCVVGSSGSGPPLTAAIDVLHVDAELD